MLRDSIHTFLDKLLICLVCLNAVYIEKWFL